MTKAREAAINHAVRVASGEAVGSNGGDKSWVGYFLHELDRAGFVILPKEPTEGMKTAGWTYMPDFEPSNDDVEQVYRAMLTHYSESGEK